MESGNQMDTSTPMESVDETYIILSLVALIIVWWLLKKPKTRIDLHGLTVNEAITEVDEFLDDGIDFLRSWKSKNLNSLKMDIITGRGLHSLGGIPRIKPAVIARLRERHLSFWESNPGCLGVSIYKNSLLTDDLITGVKTTTILWSIIIIICIVKIYSYYMYEMNE